MNLTPLQLQIVQRAAFLIRRGLHMASPAQMAEEAGMDEDAFIECIKVTWGEWDREGWGQ